MLIIQFFKRVIKSRLAQILVFVNIIKWIVFVLYPIGDSSDFYYFPFYYKFLIIIDLPAILLSILTFGIIDLAKPPNLTWTILFAVLMIIFLSLQWFLIGFSISRIWTYFTTKNPK